MQTMHDTCKSWAKENPWWQDKQMETLWPEKKQGGVGGVSISNNITDDNTFGPDGPNNGESPWPDKMTSGAMNPGQLEQKNYNTKWAISHNKLSLKFYIFPNTR